MAGVALFDVADLTWRPAPKGKVSSSIVCPVCKKPRASLVATTREAAPGETRIMCASCDRERK